MNRTAYMLWMFLFPTEDHVAQTLDPPSSLRADHLPDIYLRGSSVQVGMSSLQPVECQQGDILSPKIMTHERERRFLSENTNMDTFSDYSIRRRLIISLMF